MRGLARAGDEGAFSKLAGYAADGNAEVRRMAAMALGQSRHRESFALLSALLHDESSEVRRAAVRGLKFHKREGAYEALQEAMMDPEKSVRDAAKISLKTIRGEKESRSISARRLIDKFDMDKDGALNEKELSAAVSSISPARSAVRKGTLLKTDVRLRNIDGTETALGDLLRGVTFIYYFNSACPHCVRAEGFIVELNEQSRGAGIPFLGIASARDNIEALKHCIARAGFKFRVAIDGMNDFSTKNRIGGTPTLLLVSGDGKILEYQRGLPEEARARLLASVK